MIFFYGFPGWGNLGTLFEEIFALEIFVPWGETLRQARTSHFSGFIRLGLDIYWEILELWDQFFLSAISQIWIPLPHRLWASEIIWDSFFGITPGLVWINHRRVFKLESWGPWPLARVTKTTVFFWEYFGGPSWCPFHRWKYRILITFHWNRLRSRLWGLSIRKF